MPTVEYTPIVDIAEDDEKGFLKFLVFKMNNELPIGLGESNCYSVLCI